MVYVIVAAVRHHESLIRVARYIVNYFHGRHAYAARVLVHLRLLFEYVPQAVFIDSVAACLTIHIVLLQEPLLEAVEVYVAQSCISVLHPELLVANRHERHKKQLDKTNHTL